MERPQRDVDLKRRTRRRILAGVGVSVILAIIALTIGLVVSSKNKTRDDDDSSSNSAATTTDRDNPFITTTPGPTAFPTRSAAPSVSFAPSSPPSLSFQPSSPPSLSASPSSLPSSMPSAQPTISMAPSLLPSDQPSSVPSMMPTEPPTKYPTQTPSNLPSSIPSAQPSGTPKTAVPDDWRFRLRMHWEREFYWQGTSERFTWCMACADCRELTRDREGEGCYSRGRRCRENDQLWVQDCGESNLIARFNLLQYETFDMFRIDIDDDKDDDDDDDDPELCLTRATDIYVNLQRCDSEDDDQQWDKVEVTEPFAIRWPGTFGDDGRCLTQQHHPASDEVFYMQECRIPRLHDTLYWEADD